jgi:hypothetical protein
MDLHDLLVNALLALIIPILGALSTQLIRWINQWLTERGLALSAAQHTRLNELAQAAIAAAEEWARAQAKRGISVPGDIKMATATTILTEQLPHVSHTTLTAAINAQLATIRTTSPAFFDAFRVPES